MAVEEDEDTVMGEAVTHNPNPAPSQHLTHDGASHSNGGSDPWLVPPLLGQSLKLPVQSVTSVQSSQPTAAADNHTMSPPKSLPKSAGSGDATAEDLVQLNDSLVEENSEWSEGEDAVAIRGLPIAQLPSGLCYDVQMRYHCEVRPTADVHPEDPRRIYYIYKELCRAGLVDDPESSRPLVSRPMKRISVRNATEEEISLVHTPDHFAFVESTKGNGIQKAFYDDPNVLYISLHVYQDGKFYPGGDEGDWDHCGTGAGYGRNVNIPWPSQGMGDGDYMYAFQQVVMPIAQEFNPDLVIVASGFDAAVGDELGGCFVTPTCYAHMTHMLMTLANGKVAVCLEGGYNFRSISKSALAVTKTLMGDPPDRLHSTLPSKLATTTVRRVMMIQSQFWSCMYPKAPQEEGLWTDRLHDVIRAYQSKRLYENYKLTSLYIYRTAISKSFENQVLATPNYYQRNPLLVIFHDPPEIMGLPHPVTNKLEAHNCWLADSMKDYIGWAVGKGYAVMDVNIPKHVTIEPSGKYEDEEENRPTATEELAAYLWDNYIEPNEATEIFLLGIGNAFYGVANLLINRDTLYKRVNGVISFVAENPVRAIASHTQNSLVFVSHTHGVWNTVENRRKPSKRYGHLIQSSKSGLSEMLVHHQEEVFQWIEDRADTHESEETEEEKQSSRSPTKPGEVFAKPT
ncbi:hypothetical protein APSETT444_001609 [Aspergillus pseudonomiae]